MLNEANVTFAIGLVAFVISLYNLWDKRVDTQRAIRGQLSDVLGKITGVLLENGKVMLQAAQPNGGDALPLVVMYRQQLFNLVQQAVYLRRALPENRVTDSEYNTIAVALMQVGDVRQAEEFFRLALKVAATGYYRSIHERAFAEFLFGSGHADEGREYFRKSLASVENVSDFDWYNDAATHRSWAACEMSIPNAAEAQRHATLAADALSKIQNPVQRAAALAEHQAMLQRMGLAQQPPPHFAFQSFVDRAAATPTPTAPHAP